MEKMELEFTYDRTTKNTVRFEEVAKDNQPSKIGTLYIQKWVLGEDVPVKLKVTVDV